MQRWEWKTIMKKIHSSIRQQEWLPGWVTWLDCSRWFGMVCCCYHCISIIVASKKRLKLAKEMATVAKYGSRITPRTLSGCVGWVYLFFVCIFCNLGSQIQPLCLLSENLLLHYYSGSSLVQQLYQASKPSDKADPVHWWSVVEISEF